MVIKSQAFEEQVDLTEEEIQAYYDANKETFTTPERVKIRYIHFDPQQLKDEITPAEDEIRAYYEANEQEFNKGKEVHARHILFRVAADADEGNGGCRQNQG